MYTQADMDSKVKRRPFIREKRKIIDRSENK